MRKCIFSLILLISITAVQAQSIREIRLLAGRCCNNHNHVERPAYSPGDGFIKGAFWFYKTFISSQDSQSCVFTPSCSEYAVMAIENQGFMKGLLNTFDRLTRCHGLHADKYQVNINNNLLVDPVRNIRYEIP